MPEKNARELQVVLIYEMYPRKAARPRALKAIGRALNRVPLSRWCSRYEVLLDAAQEMRRLWEPCDEEQRTKFPHPATFFNNDMWNDLPDFRRRFPRPKRTYWGTRGPSPDVLYNTPSDAVEKWIEAGKSPKEAKRLAVKVYK